MAVISVEPVILQESILTIGADDHASAVSSVRILPNSSIVRYKGLKRNTHTYPTVPDWSAEINFAQDWADPASLANYLFEHQGETVPAVFEPTSGVGLRWAVDLVITPGAIGGDVDTVMVSPVTLGVNGAPVPTLIP